MVKIILTLLLATFCLGCGGYTAPAASAPTPGAMPAIAQLVPNTATSGGPQFVLTVNGSSFATSAVVKWNGTPQSTTQMTGSQLAATIPAAAIATPGTVKITVTNPATPGAGGIYGNGGTAAETSNSMTFTIN